MVAERNISRRKLIAAIGGAATGSVVLYDSKPEFSMELAVTKELAELSEKERGNRRYITGLVNDWIERAVEPMLSRADIDIEIMETEPEVADEAERALEQWKDISDSDKESSLLVTGNKYDRGVGLAEDVEDPMDSSVAVVGEGYDFLEIEESEWKDMVEVSEYDFFERETNYTPWKTVVAALHELGHTLSLDHSDGEIYETEDGVAASVMTASYTLKEAEPEQIRYSDDLHWMTQFSDKAVRKLN